mgnify:FL=1
MPKKLLTIFILFLLAVFLSVFIVFTAAKKPTPAPKPLITNLLNMQLISPEFKNNEIIPGKFTCDGLNINPELKIYGIPDNALSLAIILNDPDSVGGDWSHWVAWNIDPKTSNIAENSVPTGAVVGKTDFGNNKYGGPCPPSGSHKYIFYLYALDTSLDIPQNSTKADLLKALEGHLIAETELMGVYSR